VKLAVQVNRVNKVVLVIPVKKEQLVLKAQGGKLVNRVQLDKKEQLVILVWLEARVKKEQLVILVILVWLEARGNKVKLVILV
jgi:hypothetical protein